MGFYYIHSDDEMNPTKGEWTKINNTMRELNIDRSCRQINHFKFHPAEGEWHRKKKFDICCSLYDAGKPFLCEAVGCVDGKQRRFDIIDLLENEVIEVESENNREKTTSEKRKTVFK